MFRYVDGKCVQGWDTDGLRCDYTTQPACFSSETDITYAEALKNPGVARDYPPPVEPQADPVKPITPDLEAMARRSCETGANTTSKWSGRQTLGRAYQRKP